MNTISRCLSEYKIETGRSTLAKIQEIRRRRRRRSKEITSAPKKLFRGWLYFIRRPSGPRFAVRRPRCRRSKQARMAKNVYTQRRYSRPVSLSLSPSFANDRQADAHTQCYALAAAARVGGGGVGLAGVGRCAVVVDVAVADKDDGLWRKEKGTKVALSCASTTTATTTTKTTAKTTTTSRWTHAATFEEKWNFIERDTGVGAALLKS